MPLQVARFGKNFAPISHQILHLKIKCPKVHLIHPPSASLPTAAIAAIQNIKMACQLKWTNRVNPGPTEQPLRYLLTPAQIYYHMPRTELKWVYWVIFITGDSILREMAIHFTYAYSRLFKLLFELIISLFTSQREGLELTFKTYW